MMAMIRILLFSLVVLLATCSSFSTNFEHKWSKFKTTFGKSYQTPKEEFRRRQIWEKNVLKSVRHNRMADMGLYSYKQGINEYSDMNAKELKRLLNGYKMKPLTNSSWKALTQKLPKTVDWRDTGYVTPIKNQFACGSCWAFSAVGSLEGQHKKKTGQLVSLSEQNLVDCSDKEGNKGCNGGLMDQAFEYVKRNPGIDTEKFYPYLGWQQMSCYFDPMYVGTNCSGYVDLPSGDEEALKETVATIGPVSVAIDAGLDSFHLYANGIYDDPNCTDYALDHGILVIGYGTENGSDYWLIKNSWGTSWGIKGFGKMARNKNNQCGIATQASYPLM